MSKEENLVVVTRIRPLAQYELDRKAAVVVAPANEHIARLSKEGDETREFYFDYVFGMDSVQANIYEKTAYRLVENTAEGFNTTVFAYGQTGCGKSFTMIGDLEDEVKMGIIPRAFLHFVKIMQGESKKVLVHVSFVEIYNEEIRDLLSEDTPKRDLKESPDKKVFIKDLLTVPVRSVKEMHSQMEKGQSHRATASTKMNATSSRSHCIFTIYYESIEQTMTGETVKVGKMNLVDLAGSERQSKTGAEGDRLKEANKINLSLTALGNVISALVQKKKHIPFRDSKLTRLLQDSLGGNSKTLMIAACSPADYNYDETLSTLRYASRARKITNKPTVNEDPKDALIKQYASEIDRLRKMLEGKGGLPIEITDQNGQPVEEIDSAALAELEEERRKNKELEEQLQKLKNINIAAPEVSAAQKQNIQKERSIMRRKLEEEAFRQQQKELQLMKEQMQLLQRSENQKHNELIEKYIKLERENQLLLYQQDTTNKTYTEGVYELQCENDFLRQVIRNLMSEEQLGEIRKKAKPQVREVVDEEGRVSEQTIKYEVRPFYLTESKEVKFPNLQGVMANELIEKKKSGYLYLDQKPTVPSKFGGHKSKYDDFRQNKSDMRVEEVIVPKMSIERGRPRKLDKLDHESASTHNVFAEKQKVVLQRLH